MMSLRPALHLCTGSIPLVPGPSFAPPAKFGARLQTHAAVRIATDSLVGDGCIISGGQLLWSVLAPGVRIDSFSHIEQCVLMERVKVGRYARLKRVIVDKDVEIPAGAQIGFDLEQDRKRFTVTDDGIVVIPKRARREK